MLSGDLNGKEIQKREISVYVELIHLAVQQKLTRHCKASIFQKKVETKGFLANCISRCKGMKLDPYLTL